MTFTLDRTVPFQARVTDQLQRELIGWLVTVSPDNLPQPSPVWFHWNGADSITIFSKPNTPKLRNIENNPHVSFHFDSEARGEQITILSGTASITTEVPNVLNSPEYRAKYEADLLLIGSSAEQMSAEYTVPIVITLNRLRGY
ncbi:MAG: TIGR03667 family PPOX class F420-dependent oxidoreductase [Thermomicrobiales bacterium]